MALSTKWTKAWEHASYLVDRYSSFQTPLPSSLKLRFSYRCLRQFYFFLGLPSTLYGEAVESRLQFIDLLQRVVTSQGKRLGSRFSFSQSVRDLFVLGEGQKMNWESHFEWKRVRVVEGLTLCVWLYRLSVSVNLYLGKLLPIMPLFLVRAWERNFQSAEFSGWPSLQYPPFHYIWGGE